MGLFSSDKSWTNQAKNTGNQPNNSGLFGGKGWTSSVNRKSGGRYCPPVKDCRVKNTLMASAKEQRLWGVKTKKEVAAAKAKAEKVAKQQRARGRSGGKAPAKSGGWPFAGSYNPNKGKK